MSGAPRASPLRPEDATFACTLMRADPPAYRRHFERFFEAYARTPDRLAAVLASARRDRYWRILAGPELTGFFMLRGFDRGYDRPAFGVYVGEPFVGLGYGRFALEHALAWCRAQRIDRVMLKVAATNERAYSVYRSAGFRFERVCPETGHDMLEWRSDRIG